MSPYLLTYILIMVVYRLLEMTVMRRNKNRLTGSGFRGRMYYKIVIPFMLSIMEPPLEHVITGQSPSSLFFYGGIVLFAGATLFRIKSMIDIKGGFSPNIEKQEDHKLVTDGIYALIRHPLYLSVLLLGIAAAIMLEAVWAWAFILLTAAGVLDRIREEEKFLLEQFPGYKDYCKKTWRLIPGIY